MSQLRLSALTEILAEQGLPARLEGSDRTVHAVNTLKAASEGELSFLSNPKYTADVERTGASAVILKDGITVRDGLSALRCADPYAAVRVAIVALHGHRQHPQWGVSTLASVHPTARLGANANIGPHVTIGAEAVADASQKRAMTLFGPENDSF